MKGGTYQIRRHHWQLLPHRSAPGKHLLFLMDLQRWEPPLPPPFPSRLSHHWGPSSQFSLLILQKPNDLAFGELNRPRVNSPRFCCEPHWHAASTVESGPEVHNGFHFNLFSNPLNNFQHDLAGASERSQPWLLLKQIQELLFSLVKYWFTCCFSWIDLVQSWLHLHSRTKTSGSSPFPFCRLFCFLKHIVFPLQGQGETFSGLTNRFL